MDSLFVHTDSILLDKVKHISFCCATTSKVKADQCKNKRKAGSIFCGVHSTCARDRIYPPLLDLFAVSTGKAQEETRAEAEELYIQNDDHLYELVKSHEASKLNVAILRNYLKDHAILKSVVNTKGSKNTMIQELAHYYASMMHYKSSDVNRKIICVQSVVRRWSVMRRNVCNNKTDVFSMDPIYEIPIKYFYIFHDRKSGNKYGYDIRTFTQILYDPMANPKFVAKCPYTLRPFESEEIARIELYIEKLRKSGISLEIEKPKLSKEKEVEMKCVDIFLRIDLLDNYTQSKWFMDLDKDSLLAFYDAARDIWNYRIQMPMANKLKILSNGRAFEMPRHFLAKLPTKLALQYWILNEIDRFITEGVNREEKKLGAMLMLTALVEVSHAAASAMPHLVQ